MTREEVIKACSPDGSPCEILFLTEEYYDQALVGWAFRFGLEPVALYDYEKVIDLIAGSMRVDEAELDDGEAVRDLAMEYFDYNVIGAWVGERTPMFMARPGR